MNKENKSAEIQTERSNSEFRTFNKLCELQKMIKKESSKKKLCKLQII